MNSNYEPRDTLNQDMLLGRLVRPILGFGAFLGLLGLFDYKHMGQLNKFAHFISRI
ncbi:hypothetical protein [Vibrio azureus]|uniref:hypothetical protein n=1 Tax=Vibrio azureus TaxID=512649 RepID=UPI0012DEB239|nr:hypothetical protein [Vibrio azureus]